MQELGEPKFRARQVFEWVYKGVSTFDEMANLPKTLRTKLSETVEIALPEVLDMQVSKTDGTRKFLFGMRSNNKNVDVKDDNSSGEAIESVFMKYKYGNSICISSQAGCRMGCKFCASTMNGLTRNLTAGEMIGQILMAEQSIRDDSRIGHIVVMGTGEPFDNYDNLAKLQDLI